MRAIFARDIGRFLTIKLLFLALGCALYSLAERKGFSLSYSNFVLSVISDHYYLTFFMVPVFLYTLYNHLEDDMDYVLIRSSNFPRYFAVKAAAMTVNMSIFVIIQLAVILIVGIGLTEGSTFPLPDPDNPKYDVLVLFGEYFQYSWQATVVSALYMILGLSVLSIFFMTLHHFFEKRIVSIITITLYFLMVYGMKSKIPELTRIPFIFINNYIIFMYNLTYPYALQVSFASLALIMAAIVFFIYKYWNKRPSWQWRFSPRGIAPYYLSRLYSPGNVMVLLVFVAVLCLWKLLQIRSFPDSTLEDYLLYTFWGHGHGYFQFTDFIVMILMNTIPIYLLSVFLENEKKDHSILFTIRLRSKRHWAISIVRISFMFLLSYTLLLTAGSLLFAVFAGLPTGGITIIPGVQQSALEIFVYISSLKLLDLLFQFMFLLVAFLFTRQVTAGFVGILLMYSLYLLPFLWTKYIPFGMSSFAQNDRYIVESGQGLTESFISLLLAGLIVVLTVYVLLAGYKKRFK
ncbi:hypothetical protein [Paenibacillus sanguinis]|uniref:hypothetical protein n=1 Tax=Paenibacillus sanguinis TaxID=225906 RepID=UPI000381F8B0|nr:hypothetical protein [Paenibacillus sanguinis]